MQVGTELTVGATSPSQPDFPTSLLGLRFCARILKTSVPSRIIRGFSCGDCCRFRGSHWNEERKLLLMRRHVRCEIHVRGRRRGRNPGARRPDGVLEVGFRCQVGLPPSLPLFLAGKSQPDGKSWNQAGEVDSTVLKLSTDLSRDTRLASATKKGESSIADPLEKSKANRRLRPLIKRGIPNGLRYGPHLRCLESRN